MGNDEISYLLKRTEWPNPERSLAFRIQQAVKTDQTVNSFSSKGIDNEFWYLKSPLLSFMAVILALFIGVGSGLMTGNEASAEGSSTAIYGDTAASLTDIYFRKDTNNN
jgi:hypothetical protein